MAHIIVTEEQGDTLMEAVEALLLNASMDAHNAVAGTATAARREMDLRRVYELHRDVSAQLTGELAA